MTAAQRAMRVMIEQDQERRPFLVGVGTSGVAAGHGPDESRDPFNALTSPGVYGSGSSSEAAKIVGSNASSDGGSRGSGKQYILLQLDQPTVLRRITFGKYHKPHPCNLADFKVYAWPLEYKTQHRPGSSGSSAAAGTGEGMIPPATGRRAGKWVRVLRGGLCNDNVKEDFDVRWTDESGVPFATRYLKVVPLAAVQPRYNFSVWHIALAGVRERDLVERVAGSYSRQVEGRAVRLILKHLRERAHFGAYDALLKSAKLSNDEPNEREREQREVGDRERPFEHPLLTQLFENIVKRGAWDEVEACLEQAAKGPLLSEFLARTLPRPKWEAIEAQSQLAPGGRGGHQMCLDSENGIVYLFGGWDGQQDLSDFWAYHIAEGTWRLISADAKQQGGPGPRSCHKMCFCPRTGFIYVLGRFVDQDRQLELAAIASSAAAAGGRGGDAAASSSSRARTLLDALLAGEASSAPSADPSPPTATSPGSSSLWAADFYRYSTRNGQWTLLSADTAADGGPKLLFDHQMLVDHESQLLYVFGGRVIHPADPNRIELSGMYRYDVIQRSWTFLFDDSTTAQQVIPSRVGHSMLLDAPKGGPRKLWILSGQRGDQYMTDMWHYDLATSRCQEAIRDHGSERPHAGFTPRAAIDSDAREMYYFTGLIKSRNPNERLRSSFWMHHLDKNTWSLLYEYGGLNSEASRQASALEFPSSTATMAASSDAMDTDAADRTAMGAGESAFGLDSSSIDQDMSSFFEQEREPRPRYAAQMVYDARHSAFYLFGGNPADTQARNMRLDDFWRLTLVRPTVEDVLRQARFLVRQQRFYEMAKACRAGVAMQALTYLQTDVSAVVNHADEGESAVFRKLMSHLLTPSAPTSAHSSTDDVRARPESSDTPRPTRRRREQSSSSATASSDGMNDDDDQSDLLSISQVIDGRPHPALLLEQGRPTELYRQRVRLFHRLLYFFPSDCVEPSGDLADAVALLSVRSYTR